MKQVTSSITHTIIKKYEHSHHKVRISFLNLSFCCTNELWQLFQEIGHTSYKVNLQWLVESMFVGRPVEESDFAFNFDENR